MQTSTLMVVCYSILPVLAMVLATVFASARPVSANVRSLLQHFAAGLVIAIVAVELLPEIHDAQPAAVAAGFALGVLAMLGVRRFGTYLEGQGPAGTNSTVPLSITVGIDLLIDGLLLGISFSLGSSQGVLLTVALTVEVLALGTTVTAQLTQRGFGRSAAIALPVGLSLLVTVGAILGSTLLGGLSGTPLAIVVSFGVAALLYLVVEELLTQAHESKDTTAGVVAFFAGFLFLLILGV
jgi:ZIP family zinc transporter